MIPDSSKTLYLIDGSAYLYRAYYGLRPLHTLKGEPVQAVYSFCRMIKKFINTFKPEYCVLVWDSKGKTTRHEIFPEYKATRQAPPSDLFTQKEYIIQFADLIGLPQLGKTGVEADDLMFSLAKEARERGQQVVILSADKDMGQMLTDEGITLYDPFKDAIIDRAQLETKLGFPPEKLPFYFALLGDSSDNIPGVKGIGQKGATDLVQQFASLDDMYEKIDQVVKPKTRQVLIEQKEKAYLSYELFLLQYYATDKNKDQLSFDGSQWANAAPLFAELNFKSLLQEIGAPGDSAQVAQLEHASLSQYTFITISDEKSLDELVAEIKRAGVVAIDTETNGLSPLEVDLVGISLCTAKGTAYYIPTGHKIEPASATNAAAVPGEAHRVGRPGMSEDRVGHKIEQIQLPLETIIKHLSPVLRSDVKIYMHNAKFDQEVLHAHGISIDSVDFDTMVAASLIVKDWQRAALKELSQVYLNERMLTFQEVVKNNGYKDFSEVPLELATAYAAADAHQTMQLVPIMQDELKKVGLEDLYYNLEAPITTILYQMELAGISLDVPFLKKLDESIIRDIETIETEIAHQIGSESTEGINLNSPRQIEQLLFVRLGLPPQKKSAKGTGYSTDQEVLTALSKLHPVPSLLIKYRELTKLKSTYVDALPTYVNPKTGKIHTSFSQIAVATGRLASSDPNLQNIPTASGYGILVREAFKADPGNVFISADYSQIELRVLAELSGDPALIEAFTHNVDIHSQTAARLFDVPLAGVTSQMRQLGKRINFSILYGLTPFGLSKDLDIPLRDAKLYIDKYFAQYPRVSEWMEQVVQETKEKGYVTTYWGRRRYIPGIYEKNASLYQEARRVAINTKAQGTAAEIMKWGMIRLDEALKRTDIPAEMVLQIHDELLIQAPQEQIQMVEELAKKELEAVVSWKVPLVVSVRHGSTWKEVTK